MTGSGLHPAMAISSSGPGKAAATMSEYSLRRWIIRRQLCYFHPALAAHTAWWIVREARYERKMKIETALPEGRHDWSAGCLQYEATSYAVISDILRDVAPTSSNSKEVFLDAGCGAGRVVVMAALYPYVRVSGFDYDTSLLTIANRNIERASPFFRCKDVSVQFGNATTYRLEKDVSTIYLFDPFKGDPLKTFLGSVERSLDSDPRDLRIIICNPRHLDAHAYPWLQLTHEWAHFHPGLESDGYTIWTRCYQAGLKNKARAPRGFNPDRA